MTGDVLLLLTLYGDVLLLLTFCEVTFCTGSEYTMSQKYARFPKLWWSKSVRKFSQCFGKEMMHHFLELLVKLPSRELPPYMWSRTSALATVEYPNTFPLSN